MDCTEIDLTEISALDLVQSLTPQWKLKLPRAWYKKVPRPIIVKHNGRIHSPPPYMASVLFRSFDLMASRRERAY